MTSYVPAKEFEGELWVRVSDFQKAISEAERRSISARHIASLYTSPPQRKPWVGLTDEEIWETEPYKRAITDQETRWLYRFAKTIEAKLKEKNT